MNSTRNTQASLPSKILSIDEVLAGYDAVSELYPYIPPLSHWRAWEYASYKHYKIGGRILDIGCGDGRYFKLIWPKANNVIGVDMDPATAERGRQSGVYKNVHTTKADNIPEADSSFDNAFANCSLEHMDNIAGVLSEIARCLKPGGQLVCSVVTNRLIEWSLLHKMVNEAGYDEAAEVLREQFLEYHHLMNPLEVDRWIAEFEAAGFELQSHIPMMPRFSNAIFELMDSLWHVKRSGSGEFGDMIYPVLAANSTFPRAFRKIIHGLLEMETDWHDCSGAVFGMKRKP
ncbi:MAG: class I SAM-dependent methyltransferase [Pseudomonadota bacterium]